MHMVTCRILRYLVGKQYKFICWASFENLKYLAPFRFTGSVLRGGGDLAHTTSEEFVNGVFTQKMQKCFPSTLRRMNLKTQQSTAILDLCLARTRSGKSLDYIVVTRSCRIIGKLRFRNVFCPYKNAKPTFSNSPGLKSDF